ncbi:MAG: ASKHA domain-containing protein [Opitutaceae bacterium]|jgi:uncharacterized 2Fe-2S/4Fe-4S cluster protein (DUF4445 family)|nr:ASKHA domain-containing protein [Opitutaceae bacterium]
MIPTLLLRTPDAEYRLPLPPPPAAAAADATAAAQPVSAYLAAHQHPLNTRCGGRGLCRACEVTLATGSLHSLDTGATVCAPAQIRTCRHTLPPPPPPACEGNGSGHEDITLDIPARALLRHAPSVVSGFRINIPRSLNPLAPPPALPPAPPARPGTPWLGAAVDLGTTTVALLLCDLRTGKILRTETAYNEQVRQGEDVLTRINLCHGGNGPDNLRRLQQAAAGTIQKLLDAACAAASASPENVSSLVVAGNTVMLHLLAGVDPTPIGVYPFAPPFLEHRRLAPSGIGLYFGDNANASANANADTDTNENTDTNANADTDAEVHLLPGPAAYIGADLAAGILVTGMLHDDGPVMLVDVGTNGEIILKHGERMLGCATAAGPAFEGAGLASGMRAVNGVIEKIRFTQNLPPLSPRLGLIGTPAPAPVPVPVPATPYPAAAAAAAAPAPAGICGSAYVDFLAEGRRAGLLTERGRFAPPPGAEPRIITHPEAGRAFVLAAPTILVTEHDIAKLLQAKAAIAAGIKTLLDIAKLAPTDIKTLYLAGGFGMHIDLPNAIACGLLPGFAPARIEVVGNTSLGGALAVLQDRDLLPEIARACRQMESVELNLQPGFEDCYIDQLLLP